MRITVKVKPNSRENSIKETGINTFEVRVSVPAEKGKANEMVKGLIAKHFKVTKSRISLLSGGNYREKVFEIKP